MKTKSFFFYFFIVTSSFLLLGSTLFPQQKLTNWKSELYFNNGTAFTTYFKSQIKNKHFKITSPENADIRIMGWFKARIGRLLRKSPKKGIIITIKGKTIDDSLFGSTNLPVFGKLIFKGAIKQDSLTGKFYKDNNEFIGSLSGKKSIEYKGNYSFIYPKIVKSVEDNIFSKEVLNSKKWNKFKIKLKKICKQGQDDIEIFIGFNMISQDLPFTHLFFFPSQEDNNIANNSEEIFSEEVSVIFKEKNKNTAYLKIKNFETSKKELSNIMPKIVNSKYQNLIIDLRNNGGGGIDAAFEFAKYITDKDIVVGYFITNKLHYSGFQPELFRTLPKLQPQSADEFGDYLKTHKGAKLVFENFNNPIFQGNLYILTNQNTGSTCEPIVYLLKKSKRAIIIGENTAGAMLAATPFYLTEKYTLLIPIADFYTYDGVRLEGVGVKPDIETKSEDALNKALSIIKEKEE